MRRRVTITLILVCCAGLTAEGPRGDDPLPERPNVVVLLADDLGWGDVGYHGGEIDTPHIDRLAASGVRLERFYALPLCSPTRAALLTSRYPLRYGFQSQVVLPWATHGLPEEERTLPEALGAAGYATHLVGKWHLGLMKREHLPRAQGFDHHYGHYTGNLDYFTHRRMGALDWLRDEEPVEEEGYATRLLAKEAERVIREHAKGDGAPSGEGGGEGEEEGEGDTRRPPRGPLFLLVAFNAPHTPLQAPAETIAKYAHVEDEKRRVYAAMVAEIDAAIGRIVAALDETGLRESTLVVFASDNGGTRYSDQGGFRGHKGSLYEGGVRVPAVASWPGVLPAGETRDALAHIVDVGPTVLALAGVDDAPELEIDGVDLWPALHDGKPSPREEVVLNVNRAPRGRGSPVRKSGLIRGRWKLLVGHGGGGDREYELFDLEADPAESTNVADERPDVLRMLRARVEHWESLAVMPLLGGEPPDPSTMGEVWGPGIYPTSD